MKDEKGFFTMLGFAAKARKAVAGESNVEAALKKKQAELLIAAEDINPKRLEHWQRAAKENGVKIVSAGTQEQNGAAMGLSASAIVAVNDRQMKEAILARIE